MLKIGWTTGYAYLSCSIVALNLERSRVTLAPSVHLPRPPSLHLEGTNDASFTRAIPRTPRVARSLFEVEALTGLRHQLHLPVCTCVSRVTSKCDRPTRRVCLIHEWNDVGRDSIGGKVIESQKSRGKKFCNCDDDCGEVLRCDWGGGGKGRFLLEIMEYNRSLGFVVIFFFFLEVFGEKKGNSFDYIIIVIGEDIVNTFRIMNWIVLAGQIIFYVSRNLVTCVK